MSNVYYDGNYSVAQLAGQPEYSVPFASDPKLYLYKLRYWQARASFTSLPKDIAGPYGGFHVGESDFKDEGGGILSFAREFALVPDSRDEYESFVYSFQIIDTDDEGNDSLNEVPITVSSRVRYDYIHTYYPQDIYAPGAPRVFVDIGIANYLNGWTPPYGAALGSEMLAEDVTFSIWKGNIYERKSRYIKAKRFV